jgi:hypothetical protein
MLGGGACDGNRFAATSASVGRYKSDNLGDRGKESSLDLVGSVGHTAVFGNSVH